jgi:hypothetical protein
VAPDNTAPLALALLGLLLGMRHATDPDHVIAVTVIVSNERRPLSAARIGIVWGLGHTLTVLAVGAAIIFFNVRIPARVGLSMELAVALVLILLGLSSMAALARRVLMQIGCARVPADTKFIVHSHRHFHGGTSHYHSHVHPVAHAAEEQTDAIAAVPHDHTFAPNLLALFAMRRPHLRSFVVGLVHGLAGSAAIALLVLSTIRQPFWATLYLLDFCAGTIIGMALITTAISAPLVVASMRMAPIYRGLVLGSGLLSFGFGLFLVYQIGITDHVFGAAPLWRLH